MLLLFPPAPPFTMMYRKKASTTVTEMATRISCALRRDLHAEVQQAEQARRSR